MIRVRASHRRVTLSWGSAARWLIGEELPVRSRRAACHCPVIAGRAQADVAIHGEPPKRHLWMDRSYGA